MKNGGTLTKEDFKGKDEKLNGKEKYREYAELMMKEAGEGCFDWSIFEKPIIPMDNQQKTPQQLDTTSNLCTVDLRRIAD